MRGESGEDCVPPGKLSSRSRSSSRLLSTSSSVIDLSRDGHRGHRSELSPEDVDNVDFFIERMKREPFVNLVVIALNAPDSMWIFGWLSQNTPFYYYFRESCFYCPSLLLLSIFAFSVHLYF